MDLPSDKFFVKGNGHRGILAQDPESRQEKEDPESVLQSTDKQSALDLNNHSDKKLFRPVNIDTPTLDHDQVDVPIFDTDRKSESRHAESVKDDLSQHSYNQQTPIDDPVNEKQVELIISTEQEKEHSTSVQQNHTPPKNLETRVNPVSDST